jgi:hypothetical protein
MIETKWCPPGCSPPSCGQTNECRLETYCTCWDKYYVKKACAERDAFVALLNDQCPNTDDDLLPQNYCDEHCRNFNGDYTDCWLDWARMQVEKQKEEVEKDDFS